MGRQRALRDGLRVHVRAGAARRRQNPTRDDLRHAVENSHFSDGPGLAPLGYSSTDHLGYTGVQVVTLTGGNVQTTVGPLYTTDDTASGAVTQFTGTPSTPPANTIPSD